VCHCARVRKLSGTGRRWLPKIVLRLRPLYDGKTVPAGRFPDVNISGKAS
jgi:hypothetical protein